jgi:hypothetical protein
MLRPDRDGSEMRKVDKERRIFYSIDSLKNGNRRRARRFV